MPEVRKSKTLNIVWSKIEIANMLGANYSQMNRFLPEELKERTGWGRGTCYFRDTEVFIILKHFRGTLSDSEIRAIMYPRGVI